MSLSRFRRLRSRPRRYLAHDGAFAPKSPILGPIAHPVSSVVEVLLSVAGELTGGKKGATTLRASVALPIL